MSDEVGSLVRKLEKFCASDELSFHGVLEHVNRILTTCEVDKLPTLDFFHMVCNNEKVTLEIVEYLLEVFPDAAHSITDIPVPLSPCKKR